MGDINGAEHGMTADFVKFLGVQLKESRDEVQRLKKENAELRCSGNASLQKELDEALRIAALQQADTEAWRKRYEDLRLQLASPSATPTPHMLDTVRQQLVTFISQESTATTTEEDHLFGAHSASTPTANNLAASFRAHLSGLPATVLAESQKQRTHVVFKGTKLPLLSKSAMKSCIGGFCFFGPFLEWCSPASQHAFVVFPEYQYNHKPANDDATTWAKHTTSWSSLAGQQREVFCVEDENIVYAGTFFCHAGPRGLKMAGLQDVKDDVFLHMLARQSFQLESKNPKAKAKGKTYIPLLAELYKDGSATVQMIGLQRVGFNDALFYILAKAYSKRGVGIAAVAEEHETAGPQKRSLPDELLGEGWEGGAATQPGPSKMPRLEEMMDLEGSSVVWDA